MIEEEGQTVRKFPESFWKRAGNVRLFVLDEIGIQQRASPHQYESLKRLLDKRTAKPLIFTSNIDLNGIESVYDGRISDRIAAGTLFELSGDSRRFRKRTS